LFYISWNPVYILIIIFSTSIDYFACRFLTGSPKKIKRKWGLFISIFSNLSLLFVFKYYSFFHEIFNTLFITQNTAYSYQVDEFVIPVGISFYTFQTLSYSIDVYRQTTKVEKHFGRFALYVSFFPQLIAGPIERANNLMPQLSKKKWISLKMFKSGLIFFFMGLFQKIVVADNCGDLVDLYYGTYETQNGGTLLFATYLFAIQIYCDFAGYSNMAIGLAKLLGINLQANFRSPYFSGSFTKFWRRWHISLSTWMRDYIYVPLGGNKRGVIRMSISLFLTFLFAGLWHGAGFTFVLWGLLNFVFLWIEKLLLTRVIHAKSLIGRFIFGLIVFNGICLTWIFFRSPTLEQSFYILEQIFSLSFYDFYFIAGENKFSMAIISCVILLFIEVQFLFKSIDQIKEKSLFQRYLNYFIIIFSILLLANSHGEPFIYFQF